MQGALGISTATGAGGMNQMMELFKIQFLMKFLNGDGRSGSSSSSPLTFIVLMMYDQIAKYFPVWFAVLYAYALERVNPKPKNRILDMAPSSTPPPVSKCIRACIQFERSVETKAIDPRIEAVMFHVCNLPEVRSLRYNGVEMIPNFKDMIMIDNDIWFEILNPQINATPMISVASGPNQGPRQEPILYKLSTYDHDITWLHKFVEQAMERFEQEKKNKLGSETYYFDHITGPSGPFRNPLPSSFCSFSKSKFQSNRTLGNVYLRQIDELKDRVQFFLRRRDWYDSKGIPHTLGVVMYGHPGCGKTSTIKAIANETKRHIFNICLGAIKTKDAIKELFYNDNVNILQDGKMEVLNIPIKQRIYVIEDIDAMNSVVIKRSKEDVKQDQERKLKLEAEVEFLRQTQGKDIANRMMEGKQGSEEDKLDLATLLNVLDGVRETPGRIIILSTNYPERLDEALLRPGRFDMMLEFEKHSNEVLKMHLERHYDLTLDAEQQKRVMMPYLKYKWTPAEVSQILFRRIGDVNQAIDDLLNEDPKHLFKFSHLKKDYSGSETSSTTSTEDNESLGGDGTDLTALLDIKPSQPQPQPQFQKSVIVIPPASSTIQEEVLKKKSEESEAVLPLSDEEIDTLKSDIVKELEWLEKECDVLESIKEPYRKFLTNVAPSIEVYQKSLSPIKESMMRSNLEGYYKHKVSWRELQVPQAPKPTTRIPEIKLASLNPSSILTTFENHLNEEIRKSDIRNKTIQSDSLHTHAEEKYNLFLSELKTKHTSLYMSDKSATEMLIELKDSILEFYDAVKLHLPPGEEPLEDSTLIRVKIDLALQNSITFTTNNDSDDEIGVFSGGTNMIPDKPSEEQNLAREKWLKKMGGLLSDTRDGLSETHMETFRNTIRTNSVGILNNDLRAVPEIKSTNFREPTNHEQFVEQIRANMGDSLDKDFMSNFVSGSDFAGGLLGGFGDSEGISLDDCFKLITQPS